MSMQCVFVNTEQMPLRVERKGVFQYSIKDNRVGVEELCEYFYPHPDAPEHAIVSVFRWTAVDYVFGTEHLITHAIDAVKGIGNITTLKYKD